MEGPWMLRPLPFCSEELPFFQSAKEQNNLLQRRCYSVLLKALGISDVLKGLKDQLKSVLNYSQSPQRVSEVMFCYCRSESHTDQLMFDCSVSFHGVRKSSEVGKAPSYWRPLTRLLF